MSAPRRRRKKSEPTEREPARSRSGDAASPVAETAETDDRPHRLAAALGLEFDDIDLLRLALTHRSVVHDAIAAGGDAVVAASRTNERLEFLGDAILGAIVAEYLYTLDPLADEGKLTQRRVALVRAETLVRWAREIDLGSYLYLGQGEQPTDSARDRMLAGAFEALIGAIALDQGPRAARDFLFRFIDRDAEEILAGVDGLENPKGRLQELLHDRYKATPSYRVIASTGPQHAREFTVEARLNERSLGIGTGPSKRDAEQRAAAAALEMLETEQAPGDGD